MKPACNREHRAPDCRWCDKNGERRVFNRGTKEHHYIICHCRIDTPIPLVIQEDDKGCMAACVAMLIGKSYRETVQWYNRLHDFQQEGTYLTQAQSILNKHGFAYQVTREHDPATQGRRPVWPPAPWADYHFCEVQNITDTGQHGVILLRDGRVLDPWWGVVQGLHRYPQVHTVMAVYKIPEPKAPEPEQLHLAVL